MTARRYANFWMHNGFVHERREDVEVPGQLASPSRPAGGSYPGEAIRWALLAAHYRQPLDWTRDGLREATRSLDRSTGRCERA